RVRLRRVAVAVGGAALGPVGVELTPAGAVAEAGVAARRSRLRRAPALRRPAVRNRRAHAVHVSRLRRAAGVAAAGARGVAAIRVDTEPRLAGAGRPGYREGVAGRAVRQLRDALARAVAVVARGALCVGRARVSAIAVDAVARVCAARERGVARRGAGEV